MNKEEKIGMYTLDEIYDELPNGFLQRSMVDAMYFKIKELQAKVNQLETNRDEAIEYIKHSWWLREIQIYDTSKDLKGWEVEKILEILKGGSNE